MKLISSGEQFNYSNNGFMYLCRMDDGSLWLRSVAGKWAQIKTSNPMSFEEIQADFQAFLKSGNVVTENDIKVDNASQLVVDPVPVDIKDITIDTKL